MLSLAEHTFHCYQLINTYILSYLIQAPTQHKPRWEKRVLQLEQAMVFDCLGGAWWHLLERLQQNIPSSVWSVLQSIGDRKQRDVTRKEFTICLLCLCCLSNCFCKAFLVCRGAWIYVFQVKICHARLAAIVPNQTANFYKQLLAGLKPDASARALKALSWAEHRDDDEVALGDEPDVENPFLEDAVSGSVRKRGRRAVRALADVQKESGKVLSKRMVSKLYTD